MKRFFSLILILILAFSTGCEREDPSQCSYWVKRLQNPSQAREAITQVGMMKCQEASEPLKALFDEGQHRAAILASTQEFEDRSTLTELLKKALRIKDVAANAANLIKDVKLKEAQGILEEVLVSGRNPDVRAPGLEALLTLVDDPADVEGILLKVLQSDPSMQGAEATKLAAEALGKIRSEKAIPDLIISLFAGINDPSLASIYRVSRKALAQIGAPAAKPLADALNGTYKPLNEYLQIKQIPNWKWQWGPRLVEVLGDIRHEAGALPIVEKVLARDSYGIWAGLSDEQRDENNASFDALRKEWNKEVLRGFLMSALSLGRIGSDNGVEKLASTIPNQHRRDWSQRTNAALALALIGTDKAVEVLIKAFEEEEEATSRANLLGFVAMAAGPKHLKAAWKEVEDLKKRRSKGRKITLAQKYFGMKLEEVGAGDRIRAHVKVVQDCGEQMGCYLNKLTNSPDIFSKEKAAIVLWRGDRSSDTFKVFFDAFKKMHPMKERDQRLFLIAGMGRIGTQKDAILIEQHLEQLQSNKRVDPQWILELGSLHAFLSQLSS